MKRQRIKVLAAGFAVGTIMLAGCAKDNAAELKKNLTDSGMSSEDADCIVKGLQDKGVDLGQYGEPSAEDSATITEVTTDCVMAGLDIPDVSTP
jgi:hypothetical protein